MFVSGCGPIPTHRFRPKAGCRSRWQRTDHHPPPCATCPGQATAPPAPVLLLHKLIPRRGPDRRVVALRGCRRTSSVRALEPRSRDVSSFLLAALQRCPCCPSRLAPVSCTVRWDLPTWAGQGDTCRRPTG